LNYAAIYRNYSYFFYLLFVFKERLGTLE
jgi:hypothetical protein